MRDISAFTRIYLWCSRQGVYTSSLRLSIEPNSRYQHYQEQIDYNTGLREEQLQGGTLHYDSVACR